MSKPKCEIFNYIPHKSSKKITYKKWVSYYYIKIIDMYNIMSEIVDSKYSDSGVDWKSEKIFNEFAHMLYESSSKYIIDDDEKF